jgi:hypothetical protein
MSFVLPAKLHLSKVYHLPIALLWTLSLSLTQGLSLRNILNLPDWLLVIFG